MKKIRYIALLLVFTFSFGVLLNGTYTESDSTESIYDPSGQSGATTRANSVSSANALEANNVSFTRDVNSIDFSGIIFNPWNVASASQSVEKRDKKPYTIMIYMNGSDLESEDGAATDDLIQMLESGVNAENVNIVLFTGGANRWQNDVVPANECMLWEIENGLLYEIAGVGLVNMGDAGTLSSFIDFGVNNFPADKYGLIMWDHGGGSIAGYGHDEKFNKDNLTLLDMNYAFMRSSLSKNKLEFLGFDSCLMATAEMAIVASDYSKYLIASEDLEPGEGWDYNFLSVFNSNPGIDGTELGKEIIDRFFEYYGPNSDEILTLSVIDLSKTAELAGALDVLMMRCSDSLSGNRAASFNTLARKRNGTKTFGDGSPRDNDCDMVDIGDMAAKLSDLFPTESANVVNRLDECVVYNRHNSETDLKGLSVYYIYGGKDGGRESLDLYSALRTNNEHSKYLDSFFSLLVSGRSGTRTRSSSGAPSFRTEEITKARLTLWRPLESEAGCFIMTGAQENETELMASNAAWPVINGKNVCFYKINQTNNSIMYAVPAMRNGKDCDIIVLFSENYPDGKILGARNEDGLIVQKGFDEIKDGDRIAFYYEKRKFADNGESSDAGWHISDEFAVDGGLKLDMTRLLPGENNYLSLLITDILRERHFTGLTPLG